MTVSKHKISAQIVTPDLMSPAGSGHYVDQGSWVIQSPPATVVTNGFETSEDGWADGPTGFIDRQSTPAPVHGGDWCLHIEGTLSFPPPVYYIKKAHTSLTVGRTYTISAWIFGDNSSRGSIGVVGKGQSAYVTPNNVWKQVAYTFVATSASHEVRLYATYTASSDAEILMDDYRMVTNTKWLPNMVWVPDPPTPVPGLRLDLDIEDAQITLDESWSPYAQATLTCKTPPPEVLAQIDPRVRSRVQMWTYQHFGEPEDLSALSAWRTTARVIGPVERTNLVTNPSFETATTGWTATVGSMTRPTTSAAVGTSSARLNVGTGGFGRATGPTFPVTPGVTYVLSAWLYKSTATEPGVADGWPEINGRYDTTTGSNPHDFSIGLRSEDPTGTWLRYFTPFTPRAGVTSVTLGAYLGNSVVSGGFMQWDGLLLEQAPPPAGGYFDGSSTDTNDSEYAWTGTAHASTSTWAPVTLVDGAVPTLASWSARYAGRSLSAVSADYGHGYGGTAPRKSTGRSYDLALVSREVDMVAGTMTITAMSDEILAQDAANALGAPTSPAGTSLVAAVNVGLARISASLYSAVDDVQDINADALVWLPGVSAWEYMANLVTAAERRLWCDEQGAWRLGYPASAGQEALLLNPIRTGSVDTLSTDGWYDGVTVEWRWTDAGGADHVQYEVAGPTTARKVFWVTRDEKPYPRSGTAATMLRWLSLNGRNVRVEAVSNYDAAPGQVTSMTLPDGEYVTGVVQSVTWGFPADKMAVTTRDLYEAPTYSWLDDDAGVAWQDIPVGIDWTEDI